MSDLPSPQENAHARTKALRLQEENARLKAEVERLTWLQVETLNERNKAEAEVERLKNNNAYLDKKLDEELGL